VATNIDDINADSLVWEARTDFPGGGRHHPITFANATHGFLLSGSTLQASTTSDFWAYEAAIDSWTDLSETDSAFPGTPRSFGYGVSSTSDCGSSKVYLGFGAAGDGERLTDWWEFDMSTHNWKQLAIFPGEGRRHPAVNFVEPLGEIHVGLGDGYLGNYNDYWSYNIDNDEWRQLDDFPSSQRHHPFYFAINTDSYVGFGHSNGNDPYIERDWYRYDALDGSWNREEDFVSYALDMVDSGVPNSFPVTTEARVAGTEFSVAGSCASDKTLGFVLSGDGDNHGAMEKGEFHVFDPADDSIWHSLPPHPGFSRWAPGSFVLQGSSRAYMIGGYDRQQQILFSDLWTIDLKPLFDSTSSVADSTEWDETNSTELNNGFYNDNFNEQRSEFLNFESSSALPRRHFQDHMPLIVTTSFLAVVLQMSS